MPHIYWLQLYSVGETKARHNFCLPKKMAITKKSFLRVFEFLRDAERTHKVLMVKRILKKAIYTARRHYQPQFLRELGDNRDPSSNRSVSVTECPLLDASEERLPTHMFRCMHMFVCGR